MIPELNQFYPARFFGAACWALNAPPLLEVIEALKKMAHDPATGGPVLCWWRLADRRYHYYVISARPEFDVGDRLRDWGGAGTATEGSVTLSKLLTP